jgi:predicted kinase
MKPTIVVLITGHPATGKTTLAQYLAQELRLPLIAKDHIKEILLNTLGWSTLEWSRKLSVATWALLYQQVETLLRAGIGHIVESNFDPIYANTHWQKLVQHYPLQLIQVRCETDPETLLTRYRERINQGTRHPGHVDQSDDLAFYETVRQGPMNWIAVESARISVNTIELKEAGYVSVVENIRNLVRGT